MFCSLSSNHLSHVLLCRDTIALIQFESVVGGGGVLVPPKRYMQGVRAICDKYDILLHCDEVMVGFGR